MDFSALLAGQAATTAAPALSMAERMALMRKTKAPEPEKKVDESKKRD
jgi:hypothetical protein